MSLPETRTVIVMLHALLLMACDPNAQNSEPFSTDGSNSPTTDAERNGTSTETTNQKGGGPERNRVNTNANDGSMSNSGSPSGTSTGISSGQQSHQSGALSIDLNGASAIGVGVVDTSSSTLTVNVQGEIGGPIDDSLALPQLNESSLSLSGSSEEQLLTTLDSNGSARGIRLPRRTDNHSNGNVLSVNRAGSYGTIIEVSDGRYFDGSPIAHIDGDGRVRSIPIPSFTSSNPASACQLQTNDRGDVAMSVNKQLFVYRFLEDEFVRVSNTNTFATDFLLMDEGSIVYTTRRYVNGSYEDDLLRVRFKSGVDAEFLPSVSGGITALIHSRKIGPMIVRQGLVSELVPNTNSLLHWGLPFEIAVERQPAASSMSQCIHDRPHNADALPSLPNGWTANRTVMQGYGQGNVARELRQWGYRGAMAYNVGSRKVTDIPYAPIGPANHMARGGGDTSSFDAGTGRYFDGNGIVEIQLDGTTAQNNVSGTVEGIFPIRFGKIGTNHPDTLKIMSIFGPDHGFATTWWALIAYGQSSRAIAPINSTTGVMDVSKLQNIAGLDEAFVSLYRMPLPDNNERIILANRVATANIPLLSTVSGLNPSQTSTLTLNAIDTTNLRNGCSKKFLRGINNGHPFVVGATSRLHLIAGCESNQLTELSSSIAEIDGATGTVSEITPARASGERAVEAGTCTRQIISYHYTPSNPLLVLRPCDANGDLLNQLMLVQFTQHDFVTKNLDFNISNLVAADVLNPLNADYWDDRALYSPRVAILRDRLGRPAVIARGKSYTNSESTTSYGKAYLLDGGYTQINGEMNTESIKTEGMQRIGVGLDPMEDSRGSGDTLEIFQSKYYMTNWGNSKILISGVKPIVMSGDTPLPRQYETRLFDATTRQESSLKWLATENNMPFKVNSATQIGTADNQRMLLNAVDSTTSQSKNIYCTMNGQCVNPDHSATVKIVNAVKLD